MVELSEIECGQVNAQDVFENNLLVHKESEQTATFLMYSSPE
jgi:hypothetical protein